MPYTVARPSPVPWPRGLVVKNGSNSRDFVASFIPEPLSIDRQRDVGAAHETLRYGRRVVPLDIDSLGYETNSSARTARVPGVDHQIHHDLLELTSIRTHVRQAGGERRGQLDVLADHAAQHGDHVHDQQIEIENGGLDHVPATESQKLLGERGRASRGLDDLFDVMALSGIGRQFRERIGRSP